MTCPPTHGTDPPVRILFVYAWLAGGPEESELRGLAWSLDRARYRIDVVPCFGPNGIHEDAHQALESIGIPVDRSACDLSYDDTVTFLERKIAGYDVLVSFQNVADIYPALERLHIRPPLVEYGTSIEEAMAGPKHFTTRYVANSEPVRAAAAARMGDRPEHARTIPAMRIGQPFGRSASGGLPSPAEVGARHSGEGVARHWVALFDEVLAMVPYPPEPTLFSSFLQGGFEASTHRLRNGKRLDVIAATQHDVHAASDYRQLAAMGLRTVRDGVRWHLIERSLGDYDFSSFRPMASAANLAGTQVIWDLLHYGWPDEIDIWSPTFVDRFEAFARATALMVREISDAVPFWCPINEISFFAWAGGDVGYLNPFCTGRGFELKVQLARASIAAMHALREVDPRARFVHCEPMIAIHHHPETGRLRAEAEAYHQAQFQAFELLMGRLWPQIGGNPSLLDIVGVNYYTNNQWIHAGPSIDVEHSLYRPLSDLLFETYARYGRPIFIAETGVEDQRRAPWLRYVATEVTRARRRSIPVEGICLYPVMNHPGWDDDRDCHNGLLTHQLFGGQRGVHAPLAEVVADVVAGYQPATTGRCMERSSERTHG